LTSAPWKPQAAAGAPRTQQVCVALRLGEHDHHDRRADTDRLVGRQPGRARGFPVGAPGAARAPGHLRRLWRLGHRAARNTRSTIAGTSAGWRTPVMGRGKERMGL
jgi:hypothetical protein